MHDARSGSGFAIGACGSIYAAGGSQNGDIGNTSFERFDVREGKWHLLADMNRPRGYTAACIGNAECFYISGGLQGAVLQGSMEFYDPRMNRWQLLPIQQKQHYQQQDLQSVLWRSDNDNGVVVQSSSGNVDRNYNDRVLMRACHHMFYLWR